MQVSLLAALTVVLSSLSAVCPQSVFYSPSLTAELNADTLDRPTCDFFTQMLYDRVLMLSYLVTTYFEYHPANIFSPQDFDQLNMLLETKGMFIDHLFYSNLIASYTVYLFDELKDQVEDPEMVDLLPFIPSWPQWWTNIRALTRGPGEGGV